MIENIRLSLKGILSHKMRSVLTMLGIIIGIASIIIIVSIIQGTSSSLKESMVGNGKSTITIELYDKNNTWDPYSISESGTIEGITTIPEYSIKEVQDLDGVVDVTPIYLNQYNMDINYNGKRQYGKTYGVEEKFFEVNDLVLTKGRLFTEKDYENKQKTAIISSDLSGSFFPNEEPLGKTITLNNEMFVVVGVVTEIQDYSNIKSLLDYEMKMDSSESSVYIPYTSWDLVAGYDDIQKLVIKVENADYTATVGASSANILNENIFSEQYEYKSGSLSSDASGLETITQMISILLVGIASIALLVGGIGVMNIMLVSVTERTKEIGLKKALGAKRRVILSQFLTEAVVLTSMGGIIGVLIGIGVSYLIGMIINLPISISVTAVAISVGFSMAVGIIFGLIPSVKASKLDPIEALRYE